MVQTKCNLDVDYQANVLSAIINQYDTNSRQLAFQLTKGGEKLIIPQNTTARCFLLKPDKTIAVTDCQIINNEIILTFTEQMTASAGIALAQIFFTNTDDSSVLTSVKFKVRIDETLISNSKIISTNEWESLTKQLLLFDESLRRLVNVEDYINEHESVSVSEIKNYLNI